MNYHDFYSFLARQLWLLERMSASCCDLDLLDGLLVDQVHLLDESEYAEAFDDAAEDNCLAIHEGERCTERHVELALVGVWDATSLAHAEKAGFCMLDMEGFVGKLTVELGVAILCFSY